MMKNYCSQKSIKFLFIFLLTFLSVSCIPLKHSPKNAISEQSKGIIVFFVNDTVNQYFIKPIEFFNKEKSINLIADFTFRTGDLSEEVDAKFTLISSELINVYDFKSFYLGDIKLVDEKIMFQEKNKKKYKIRISGILPKDKFSEIEFEAPWVAYYKNQNVKFKPKGKAQKVLANINSNWIY